MGQQPLWLLLTNEDPGSHFHSGLQGPGRNCCCSRNCYRSHCQRKQLLLRLRFLREEVFSDKVFKFMYLQTSLGQCNMFLHLQPHIDYSSLWHPSSVHSRLCAFSFFQLQGLCTGCVPVLESFLPICSANSCSFSSPAWTSFPQG